VAKNLVDISYILLSK